MAHMFPETLEHADVRSPAERLLYDAFQHQVSDHFYVFHSVAWLGREREGKALADGEADFIVIHPKMGILVIEVKGGTIGFDASEGWFSIRRDGSRVDIKDPFGQVRRNKYALRRKIESLPNWQGPFPTIGHAVAFPDGVVDDRDLAPEAPREIILFHNHLSDVESWLRQCLKYWAGDNFVAPGKSGLETLQRLLRKSWLMREPRLGEEIGPEEAAIHYFTTEQFKVLELLAARPRAAIQGCAGSGKTVLALEKAKRLSDEGFRTLLACYNRPLAEELARVAGKRPRLSVRTFHSLCREAAARLGDDKEMDWNPEDPDFFSVTLPDALIRAAETLGDEFKYDAVVVDEGQDFEPTWWLALRDVLIDPERSILYIFFDDNQRCYSRDLHLPIEELPYRLTTNCRNTRQIYRAVLGFYASDLVPECIGPEGRPPEITSYDGTDVNLRFCLTSILTNLVFEEKVSAQDIVLLSPGGLSRPPLDNLPPPGAFQLVETLALGQNQIQVSTIRLFKGLERPVVILLLPGPSDLPEELVYVGLSRARNHAVVLYHELLTQALAVHLPGVAVGPATGAQ